MSFLETPRFPDRISLNMEAGPTWSTRIVVVQSGYESRNVQWSAPLMRYNLGTAIQSAADREEIFAWMRCLRGQGYGFRLRDPIDYRVDLTNGYVNSDGLGNGTPNGQLYKFYALGAFNQAREITKPVYGALPSFYLDAVEMISPAPDLDTASGLVTFYPQDSAAVVGAVPISAGATSVTLTRMLAGVQIGDKLYVSGISGTIAAALNGAAHTVQAIEPSPATYELAVATDGLGYASGGLAALYPQQRQVLRWVGEFDVPVRFETDSLRLLAKTTNFQRWRDIPLVEIRI